MSKLKKYEVSYFTLEDFETCFDATEAKCKHTPINFKRFQETVQTSPVYASCSNEAMNKVLYKLSGELVIWIGLKWFIFDVIREGTSVRKLPFLIPGNKNEDLAPVESYTVMSWYLQEHKNFGTHYYQEFAFFKIKDYLKE